MNARYLVSGVLLVGMVIGLALPPRARCVENPGARDLYLRYCAECHGPAGRGDGPAAAGLQPRPTDLTRSTLSRKELIQVIDGRRRPEGHGTGSMPLWGSLFTSQGGAAGQRTSEIRVEALADEVVRLREPAAKEN